MRKWICNLAMKLHINQAWSIYGSGGKKNIIHIAIPFSNSTFEKIFSPEHITKPQNWLQPVLDNSKFFKRGAKTPEHKIWIINSLANAFSFYEKPPPGMFCLPHCFPHLTKHSSRYGNLPLLIFYLFFAIIESEFREIERFGYINLSLICYHYFYHVLLFRNC